jgi:hypothetical protein
MAGFRGVVESGAQNTGLVRGTRGAAFSEDDDGGAWLEHGPSGPWKRARDIPSAQRGATEATL